MAQTNPIRGSVINTKKWTGVDSSTGQAISFSERCLAVVLYIYTTTTTTPVSQFQIAAPSTSAQYDTVTITGNVFPISVSKKASTTLCTVYAASGETVDIHAVMLG